MNLYGKRLCFCRLWCWISRSYNVEDPAELQLQCDLNPPRVGQSGDAASKCTLHGKWTLHSVLFYVVPWIFWSNDHELTMWWPSDSHFIMATSWRIPKSTSHHGLSPLGRPGFLRPKHCTVGVLVKGSMEDHPTNADIYDMISDWYLKVIFKNSPNRTKKTTTPEGVNQKLPSLLCENDFTSSSMGGDIGQVAAYESKRIYMFDGKYWCRKYIKNGENEDEAPVLLHTSGTHGFKHPGNHCSQASKGSGSHYGLPSVLSM